MKCYVHHEEEAVVNCAKCGVAMCHACEEKALFRTANGTGQPCAHGAVLMKRKV